MPTDAEKVEVLNWGPVQSVHICQGDENRENCRKCTALWLMRPE